MTKIFSGMVIASFLLSTAASAQQHPEGHHPQSGDHSGHQMAAPSPYAAEQNREIQALSAAEISDLLKGAGMGLARPAELHHYPGPLHVLELSEELQLTPQQRSATEAVFGRMKRDAVHLGAQIVEAERSLDRLFSSGGIDRKALDTHVTRIAKLQGELRATHLRAHLEMKEILTADQIAAYDRLRGYGESGDVRLR